MDNDAAIYIKFDDIDTDIDMATDMDADIHTTAHCDQQRDRL